ncbi:MAG: hypothetical protein HYU69_08830 [Bacteroidetes bacterium]|nr:hypothetical protein [Bacteroidota bacterium]
MKISELKKHLSTINSLHFVLPNGTSIPAHFHITEMGLSTKHFIDCGGEIHSEKLANIQVWVANDFDHRLKPTGLSKIVDVSKKILGDEDLEIEVEYQTETIGKYSLEFKNGNFTLVAKYTDCLAKVNCGTPAKKKKLVLSEIETTKESCCTPGGGCC